MGDSGCWCTTHHLCSARIIGTVLREYQEYMIAYIQGASVIPIINHLFSYMYKLKCVTQNPYRTCIYVTLDNNPQHWEILLNVFMKVESDVASIIIRQRIPSMYTQLHYFTCSITQQSILLNHSWNWICSCSYRTCKLLN